MDASGLCNEPFLSSSDFMSEGEREFQPMSFVFLSHNNFYLEPSLYSTITLTLLNSKLPPRRKKAVRAS